MGKKKKKKKSARAAPERSAKVLTPWPEMPDPDELIAFWSKKAASGFPPGEARQALGERSKTNLDESRSLTVQALLWLSETPLGRKYPLNDASGSIGSACLDNKLGRFYIADSFSGGLSCLDKETGRRIWRLEGKSLGRPRGMTLSGDSLIVCDSWNHRVVAFGADNGVERWSLERAAGEKDKLCEPWDVAVVDKDSASEIWVCDRGKHRICRYSADGRFLGQLGQRGLQAEEIRWHLTKPEGKPEKVFFEFPQAIDLVADRDGAPGVFVWDSWNRRVVCLSVDGRLKRQFGLSPAGGNDSKFYSSFKALESPQGPVFLATDDLECALLLWGPEGEFLLKFSLKADLFPACRQAEALRIVPASGAPTCLLTGNGLLVELRENILDTLSLLEKLTLIRPGEASLALARWECLKGRGDYSPECSGLWAEVFSGYTAGQIAQKLLRGEDALTGRLERNLGRLVSVAGDLSRAGLEIEARNLAEALHARLNRMALEAESSLLSHARIKEESLDSWTDALTEIDLALFKTNGRNKTQESHFDPILEEIKEHPAAIRRAAWNFHTLRNLSRKAGAAGKADQESACRLARSAAELLEARRSRLVELDCQLNYKEEPRNIRGEELTAAHSALLSLQSIERVAEALAEEIARTIQTTGECVIENSGELREQLSKCAYLAAGYGKWDELASRLNPRQPQIDSLAENIGQKGAGDSSSQERLENLRTLVENMESYLKSVGETRSVTSDFNKVVARQKELFSVKASLLAAGLRVNGDQSSELIGIIEQARRLAGEAWKTSGNLRKFHPMRRD
ncbi:MAG TPA: hypothetical protein VM123_16025 [archaeon]|nr:hypothetical protein [archaeon]